MARTAVTRSFRGTGPSIEEVVGRLAAALRWDPLGNLSDPLDELVYIVLSSRTRGVVFQSMFKQLRERYANWDSLAKARTSTVERILRPSGLSKKKAAWLKSILLEIHRREGRCSLNRLKELSDREAEEYLVSLPGVGLKTARCVLMYSLGRKVFPVDANVRRVLERLKLIPIGLHYNHIHDYAQNRIPPDLRAHLHVYCVIHGRDTCLPRKPKCVSCCLRDLCEYPRSQALSISERT